MKKFAKISAVLCALFLSVFFVTGCSDDDDEDNDPEVVKVLTRSSNSHEEIELTFYDNGTFLYKCTYKEDDDSYTEKGTYKGKLENGGTVELIFEEDDQESIIVSGNSFSFVH